METKNMQTQNTQDQEPLQYFRVEYINDEHQLECVGVTAHNYHEAMSIARKMLGIG